MKRGAALALFSLLLLGGGLCGCRQVFPPQIKILWFRDIAFESENIFIGRIIKMEEAKANSEQDSAFSYDKLLPVEIAVSEVWAGKISEGDSVQKMLPLWYAEKLKAGDQCLFLTEHSSEKYVFFDVMKVGSEDILEAFVKKDEVEELGEADGAFNMLPKTLDEAKAIVEEMQALKQSGSSGGGR